MAPPRPLTITDEEIIKAAHEMFLEHGLDVTTASIAEHAGISEATIFKRFGTKQSLFAAAMSHGLTRSTWHLALRDQTLPIGAHLEHVAQEMLRFFTRMIPKLHMSLARHTGVREALMANASAPPAAALRALIEFLDRAVERDALKPHDTELSARLLIAAMHHYAFFDAIELNRWFELDAERYVASSVKLLFERLIVAPTPVSPGHLDGPGQHKEES